MPSPPSWLRSTTAGGLPVAAMATLLVTPATMLLMIPACSAEVLEVYSWADTVPLGPCVKISAASRSPSVTCLRAITAVGADLTVTPLSASSVSTT